jgi:hypothetical protein
MKHGYYDSYDRHTNLNIDEFLVQANKNRPYQKRDNLTLNATGKTSALGLHGPTQPSEKKIKDENKRGKKSQYVKYKA